MLLTWCCELSLAIFGFAGWLLDWLLTTLCTPYPCLELYSCTAQVLPPHPPHPVLLAASAAVGCGADGHVSYGLNGNKLMIKLIRILSMSSTL